MQSAAFVKVGSKKKFNATAMQLRLHGPKSRCISLGNSDWGSSAGLLTGDPDRFSGALGPGKVLVRFGHCGDVGQNIVRHRHRAGAAHVDMQQQGFTGGRKPPVDMSEFLKQLDPFGVEIE